MEPKYFANTFLAAAAFALLGNHANAAVITFADFNPAATGNTANVGGSATNLTVSRAGAASACSFCCAAAGLDRLPEL